MSRLNDYIDKLNLLLERLKEGRRQSMEMLEYRCGSQQSAHYWQGQNIVYNALLEEFFSQHSLEAISDFDHNGKITKLEIKIDKLTAALHDAISRPIGVVPDSAMEFYDPNVSQSNGSVTGVIQAFDDYDDGSRTYTVAVRISEDDLKDWMKDGVEIMMSKKVRRELRNT